MLSEALSYPRRGENWLLQIGIGGVLYFLGFLVLPFVLIEGYLYRVLERTVRGETTPPEWNEWVDLFVDGIKMWVVQFGYGLAPTRVIVVGSVIRVGGFDTIGVLVVILGTVLAILAGYLLPAALTNFARTESVAAAFAVDTVREIAMTRTYLVHVVMSLVLGIVLGIIGAILSAIIIGIFVMFYAQVAVYYLWSRGVAESLGASSAV